MAKLIQVPYIKQPKNSAKCGAACAAMLIKYYKGSKVNLDDIWTQISATSPELHREYCKTFKIGAYINRNYFRCCTVRYTSLKRLLEFCNTNEVAPIINHKSFENSVAGHFSVIKNIADNSVIINDPENEKRKVVSLSCLEKMATKDNPNDEIGGNTAIIPSFNFSIQTRSCPHCGSDIDVSFSRAINSQYKIVEEDLCQDCDKFSPTK